MTDEKTLRVTLVKSPIGYGQKQRATLSALGLNKLHTTREYRDNPQVRGMINRVSHLVSVEELGKK